ncbi:MAG: hypothetical protein FWC45_05240, partial [Treponema sp.]|nr:hypothetical protein [Treponema sp.]
MAKKEKAVYAPGELRRVRDKLGTLDKEEAKLMAQKLGGEVGYERTDEEEERAKRVRYERVDVKIGDRPTRGGSRRQVELALEGDNEAGGDDPGRKKPYRRRELDPEDDPAIPIKVSYWDRVKMDKIVGQPEFDIKSSGQVFFSMVSLFADVPDYVSPAFIARRMPEYYKKIELLVVSTRNMFPRNNLRRNERMKKSAPLVYAILDTIRYWNIEKISGDLARIQAHPRRATVGEFADILKAIYKPLFILDRLDPEAHIRGAYKILYKLLYIENPMEAQSKYQELIRTALTAFFYVRRDVHYLLYPMLMKSVSARYVPYERFFSERKHRIMAFLNVTEADQINPEAIAAREDIKDGKPGEEQSTKAASRQDEDSGGKEEGGEISEEEKARLAAEDAEKKALDRGLLTLELLFPRAGWDRLSAYPDLYPYFVGIFDLKKGIVNIAPTDPMQQILILMRILEELFFGLRYVSFGAVPDSSGGLERIDAPLGEIINNWHYYLDVSFDKEYLPRMAEYIRILESSAEEQASPYAKKVTAELHWIKRLYFLPYYKFESLVPPPFQKRDITPIYAEVRKLRKYLGAVAAGIEQGNRAGGSESHAPCDGIDNPWEPYVFQVANPLSMRLDSLLAPKTKYNAALIFFCLAVTTVLDYLLNNENSWAYSPRPGPLFRSINGEG